MYRGETSNWTLITKIFAILCSLFVGAVSLYNVGTYSWFTSSISGSAEIITGTVKIEGPGDTGISEDNISDLYPGWEQVNSIEIRNSGSLTFRYRMYIDDKDLKENPLYDGTVPIQLKVARNGETIKDYIDINKFGSLDIGYIEAGKSDHLSIFMKLPLEADQSCNNQTADIKFVFDAKQIQEDALYPGEIKVKNINIKIEENSPDGFTWPLSILADVEPSYAANKEVSWTIEQGTGKAVISEEGLLMPIENGTVTVIAAAKDGSGTVGRRTIEIAGVANAKNAEELKYELANPDVKAVNLSPGMYNFDQGLSDLNRDDDIVLYCSNGSAIVNIIGGLKPERVIQGIGTVINENVIYVNSGESIQSAVDAAPENGVIYIGRGDYYEQITINKPLTMLGMNSWFPAFKISEDAAPKIQGFVTRLRYTKDGSGIKLIGKGTSNVTIKGICFESTEGIICSGESQSAENIVIENNLFRNIKGEAISFNNISKNNISIRGNAIDGWDGSLAIKMLGSSNSATITDNYIRSETSPTKNSLRAINIQNGNNVSITDNIIENIGSYAIWLSNGGSNIWCTENIIKDSFVGIMVHTGGSYFKDIMIGQNHIINPLSVGISITRGSQDANGISNLYILKNKINTSQIYNNFYGIRVSLDNKYEGQHGLIKINGNSLEFNGKLGSFVEVYGLLIRGKLNRAEIWDNIINNNMGQDGSSTLDALCIKNVDKEFGSIPPEAVINGLESNIINGFECLQGLK